MPNQAVILSAARSAIGTYQGSLASFTAPQLGALAIREAVKRANINSDDLDEVIMGQVVQGGSGQAPGRQAAIYGGIPSKVPVMTVNKVCGSGLKAVMLSAQAIKAGDGHLYVAGGQESMSNTPYVLHGAKTGLKFGHKQIQDMMILDGLWDSFNDFHMGNAAEYTATKACLTREMLDEYSYNSQQKASKAIKEGKFRNEIFPIEIKQAKGDPKIFDTDEGPRADTTIEKLAKLKAAFQKDGVVTAGNAPGLNDGSAALVVSSMEYAEKHGHKPIARIIDYTAAGTDPKDLFFAPIFAVRKMMAKLNVGVNHWDLIEANEAFAAQCLA
ncbi:MAG: acetyl-CoA acetyltransferase, partial [candidate division Zixibacteria bacterium RBG_16_53_22]